MTRVLLSAAALAAALIPFAWSGSAQAQTCDDPFVTDLVAFKNKVVGTVEVCNDDLDLTVTYVADENWCLLRTRLEVEDDLADIPQTRRGRPLPWRFDHRRWHKGCVDSFPVKIALGDWEPGTELVVAANALVRGKGKLFPRGAWGAGTPFPKGKGTSYFHYTVQGEEFLCGGSDSKCVFVTSAGFTVAEFGGLDGADAICQQLAGAPDSLAAPGTYKAWLSDSNSSAADRFIQATVPYRRVDGVLVAENWAALVNTASVFLRQSIRIDEEGDRSLTFVWTGTNPDGSTAALNCMDWTEVTGPGNAVFGWTGTTSPGWTDDRFLACSSSTNLYCFQQ